MESSLDVGVERSQQAHQRVALAERVGASTSIFKHTRPIDLIVRIIVTFCGVVSIFTTIGIVFILFEETALFLDSRAFVIVKSPVVNEDVSVTLTKPIRANDATITVELPEGEDRIPLSDQQFVTIGDEVAQVVSRGRRTIEIQRGQHSTEALAHEAGTTVFAMIEEQVKPTAAMTTEDTVVRLEAGFGNEFEVGQVISIGTEEMRVTAVNSDSLSVERAINDTNLAEHRVDQTVHVGKETSIINFLTGTSWRPTIGEFGIWPLLTATLVISLISLVVAVPLGLGAAIYLSEYAAPNVRDSLKPILEILAGVPTVVYGFFALTFMSPVLRGIFGEDVVQFQNQLSAGLVVGILIIPYVSSLAEDALSSVPRSLREASYGLGATKLETTIKVVLPAAASGVSAALIVAVSRAIGETMIVTLAAGSLPRMTFNVFEGAETITGHIARISGGDLSYNSIQYTSIFALGAALFVVTLGLNILSNYVQRRFREDY